MSEIGGERWKRGRTRLELTSVRTPEKKKIGGYPTEARKALISCRSVGEGLEATIAPKEGKPEGGRTKKRADNGVFDKHFRVAKVEGQKR